MRLKVAALGTVLLCMLSVAGAQAEKHARPIYRCQIDGITTFSDRACGDAIEVYKLEFDNAAQLFSEILLNAQCDVIEIDQEGGVGCMYCGLT